MSKLFVMTLFVVFQCEAAQKAPAYLSAKELFEQRNHELNLIRTPGVLKREQKREEKIAAKLIADAKSKNDQQFQEGSNPVKLSKKGKNREHKNR